MRDILDQIAEPVTEVVGNEPYKYYPLGDYIVRAPGVCGGRPTFKYTRINVDFILNQITYGKSIQFIVDDFDDPHLTEVAIQEAMLLTTAAFNASPQVLTTLAA